MNAPSNSSLQQEWRSFLHEPAAYVDSVRLAACFGDAVSPELCNRLKTSLRVRDRLSRLILEHYGPAPEEAEPSLEIDRTIALMSVESLSSLALGSGAIYWSEAIAGTVLSETVEALHKGLGETVWTLALRHRELAGPARSLNPVDTLTDRIFEDGWRCLAAWRLAQPKGVAMRVNLKLPPDRSFDEVPVAPFDSLGSAIVRCAAGAYQGE